MEQQHIRFPEKLGFGLFSISCNIVIQFVSTFILFYFTDVFGLPPALSGAIISFGVVWDGINDPLIASYADNHRFKNGERVRPYALYAPIPLAIITVLMFTAFKLPMTGKAVYAIAMYVIFYSLTTILRLPSYAMPQLATGNRQERLMLNTFVSGGASLGGVLASVMCWPLVRGFAGVDATGEMINPEYGFIMGAAVVGLIVIFGSWFSYFTTKERIRPKAENEEKLSIFASFKMLLKNRNFCWNTAFSTMYFINNTLLTTTLVYYCKYVLMDSGKTTLVMAVFAVGSLAALPLVKLLDKKLGRRRNMMLGAGLTLISKVPFVIAPHSLYAMMACALIMGLSVAINIVVFSTTRAEVADLVEHENGRRIDSMVINLMGFLNKCGTSLTTLMIGLVLQIAGYNGELTVQPTSAVNAIIALMGWVAVGMSLIMIFCASKITVEQEVEKMHAEQQAALADD
ncbi:MAG: MFS transporter [Eubacteriales bacterium]|nr:MFS transporter [Eubacteriales bacterium]